MKPPYPKGSEWRKWDLHVHTPASYDWHGGEVTPEELVEKAIKEGLSVIAVTDHHRVGWVDQIANTANDKGLTILPGVELRTDKGNRGIHVIGIFPEGTSAKNIYDKILSPLGFSDSDISTKGDDQIYCDFEEACKKIKEMNGIISLHAGKRSCGIEQLNSDARSLLKKDIANQVDILDVTDTAQVEDYEKKVFPNVGRKWPMIVTSDSVDRQQLSHKKGHSLDCIGKSFTWIKADPTFEGLKQILYEPECGERVLIGPIEPDQKDGYRVIRKIKFNNTNDFPEEIEFNKNLCSIIGSRSSGKSALLAYVAHSIDKKRTEKMIHGPGEGENYHWNKITFRYAVEWENGQSNDESPGKIVYIPQNYLFEKSKDPDEIKENLKPVLFKVLPDFEARYAQTVSNINALNQRISDQADNWFALSDTIQSLDNTLKDLGDKKAVEKGKEELNSKIGKLKEKNELSEDDIKNYKKITADISAHESRIKQINAELLQISDVSTEIDFFKTLKITPSPALENLPRKLQDGIRKDLIKKELEILSEANKQVVSYKESIKEEKTETEEKILKIKKENSDLIEKYHKNTELEELVHKINEHIATIKKIDDTVTEKKNIQSKLTESEKTIKSEIDQRKSLLEQLTTNINNADQSSLMGIKFGIEYGFDESLGKVTIKINTRDRSEFIEKGSLKIKDIRENPVKFLSAIYSEKQKVNSGNDKKEVAQEILTLTEKILFTAEMEGDKIGGFSEPTMTPGKRALFALRLILDESDDMWPLLIDQPEDDLDSRSVYAEIVPFLKKKKKERQIILVSHNANLVIGADSEQIIVANRNGDDRKNKDGKQFNYLTGSIEYTKERVKECEDTLDAQGIREHACEILDGGKTAFENREKKYGFKS